MHNSFWIVSSKTEGPNGNINVTFRPDANEALGGNVTLTLAPATARSYEPGTRVVLSISADA